MIGEADSLVHGVLVRLAGPGDRAALEAMFQRCSPVTVYRRFHGHVRAFPRAYLDEALAGVPEHYALVATDGPCVVALASLRVTGDALGDAVAGGARAAEIGLLIEDAWQRRGLGGRLLARLMAHADSTGIGVLHAQMLTEQDWILGMLAPYGTCASAFRSGVREVKLRRSGRRERTEA